MPSTRPRLVAIISGEPARVGSKDSPWTEKSRSAAGGIATVTTGLRPRTGRPHRRPAAPGGVWRADQHRFGDENEAINFMVNFEDCWKMTPGALEWLKNETKG